MALDKELIPEALCIVPSPAWERGPEGSVSQAVTLNGSFRPSGASCA